MKEDHSGTKIVSQPAKHFCHIYLYLILVWPGRSRLEYCLDNALKSPSPFPLPPLAGSNVGLAAVVILDGLLQNKTGVKIQDPTRHQQSLKNKNIADIIYIYIYLDANNDVILVCGGKTQKNKKTGDCEQRRVRFNDKLLKKRLNSVNAVCRKLYTIGYFSSYLLNAVIEKILDISLKKKHY